VVELAGPRVRRNRHDRHTRDHTADHREHGLDRRVSEDRERPGAADAFRDSGCGADEIFP